MGSRFAVLALITTAVFTQPVVADDDTPISPVFTILGTVLLPDGRVAKDAILEPTTNPLAKEIISATMTDGQFDIQTSGATVNSFGSVIRTDDDEYQATIQFSDHFLRSKCVQPMTVVLEPTRLVQVQVVHNQKPVVG